ncbi:MAG: DUF4834 domain-containing protein [Bacteroidota bacterium]
MLLKFLLIVGLVGYVIYKFASFFFRAGAASEHLRNQQQHQAPKSENAKSKKAHNLKGGEYIDYEEVK